MQHDEIIAIKQEIIESARNTISGIIDDTKRQLDRTRQDVIEAPGRMQSRYDSSKQESGYLADALQKRLTQINGELTRIGSIKIDKTSSGIIETGSLVAIIEGEKKRFFMILLGGGGTIVKSTILNCAVTIITPVSPIGKTLMNMAKGDLVIFGQREMTVDSVF